MELVYLWVEDYKNIHRQGFNFSPRFECKFYPDYDENGRLTENSKLEIKENDYVNIFPENINITAIVGKNGSGKSSILRELAWQSILINIDGVLYAKGFGPNSNYHNFPQDFTDRILYVNYDLMLPSEFTCFSCHQTYPSNKNLYKLIENSKSIKNNFNSEKFYQNFKTLMIEYTNSFDLKFFTYKPSYVKIFVNKDKWHEEIKNILSITENHKFISFVTNNLNKEISIIEFRDIYFKYKEIFLTLESIRIDIYDNIGRKYFDLSQGERKVYTELMMIYDAINKHHSNTLLLVLDEPDLTLHPEWQVKYFKELISLLESQDKKIHVLITTHSPFIISDIPSQNIIFVDTDKEGNCKVVEGLKKKKQTFGANIHTLLSDSFFMKDGLMGEFAKSKINEIKMFYEKVIEEKKTDENIEFYNKNQDRFWQIQKIIGEPFLQKIVKNQLEEIELILLGKDKAIDNEIARLQALKESFKNA